MTAISQQSSRPIEHIEVIWFNSMGVFSEPIFSIGLITLTMKQLVLLFTGLLLAYGLATVNPYVAVAVAGMALMMAFYKPRVMTAEEYLMSAIRFFAMRSSRTTEKKHIAAMFAQAPSSGDFAVGGQKREEGNRKK
jgi:hypothetical protein